MTTTYTDIVIQALTGAVLLDLYIVKTQLLTRISFWLSYAIIFPFQLITNYWLTHRNIVIYSPATIMGRRLAGAPIEDLIFGFSLILSTLSVWVWLGQRSNASHK